MRRLLIFSAEFTGHGHKSIADSLTERLGIYEDIEVLTIDGFDLMTKMQKVMAETYKEMYGRDMQVTAIHAGLECGMFCGKISGLDCVSLGPDLYDIHTPSERMSISSAKRVWEYLLAVLAKL